MKHISDRDLAGRCRQGDTGAFDILYQKYSGPLVSFLYRMTRDAVLAEDIFQETFIRVLENIDRYDPAYCFSTWVYKIASNFGISELQKRKREYTPAVEDDHSNGNHGNIDFLANLPCADEGPEEFTERRDDEEYIQALLESLPEKHRLTFVLKFYYDMTYKEIAYIEECSEGTIKSRIHYGLEDLRQKLREDTQCTRRIK